MNATNAPRINFAEALVRAGLHALMEASGVEFRNRRAACPLHGGSNRTALSISDDGKRWKCFSCGMGGDAIDWLVAVERITKIEAAARLLGADLPTGRRSAVTIAPKPKAEPKPAARAWHDPDWQAEVETIIAEAEAILWGPSGHPTLDWLRARGLMNSTISRFCLGFLPDGWRGKPLDVLPPRDGKPQGIRAPRGVTIPWVAPGANYSDATESDGPRWCGCNVRCLADDPFGPPPSPKYLALKGSERGHAYPYSHAVPGVPALVCEGEIDALTAWQECGWIVNTLTVGSTSTMPTAEAMAALSVCPAWLSAFDHDANHAGDRAGWKFAEFAPGRCRRLWLPDANDLNDFHRSGGNVLAWLHSEFTRLGWRWPSRSAADPLEGAGPAPDHPAPWPPDSILSGVRFRRE